MAIGVNQPRRAARGATYRLVPFEEDDTTTLVARRKVVSGGVKLNGGYNVG